MKVKIGIMVFCFTSLLFAQSPEEAVSFMANANGVGAKAQAMGNAFVGVADDYSALYWNPAGLTLLDASELDGSFYHLRFANEASFANSTLLEDQTYTRLKSLGLAYKFPTSRGSLVIAVGYDKFRDYDDFLYFSGFNTQSNGLEFELEDDNQNSDFYFYDRDVLQTEQIIQSGNLSAWSFGGGIQLSPNFAAGITLNFYSGVSSYFFDFYQDDVDNFYTLYPANFDSYELHQSIESNFSGFGMKLGGLFKLNEDLRLGVTIDLPSSIHVKETWGENDALFFDDGYVSEMDLGSGEWEYVVKYPIQVSGGIALDLKQVLVAGSVSYRDWTQVQFDVPSGYALDSDYESLLQENSYFGDLFRPVLTVSGGGEIRVPSTGLKLRGGYRVVPSPFYNADKKYDKKYISAGFGYDVDKSSTLNFTTILGSWTRESVDDLTPGGTQENIKTTHMLAGVTFRF